MGLGGGKGGKGGGMGEGMGEGMGRLEREGGRWEGKVPGLRDDDVVEGGVAFAEAGEADFDDHVRGAWWGLGWVGMGEG